MLLPNTLCRKHLLGEHGEIHKHRHNFVKGHRIDNRIEPVTQISPFMMKERHDELATEMTRRGYNHNSPYTQPNLSKYPDRQKFATVNTGMAKHDLHSRCEDCKKLWNSMKNNFEVTS